MAKKLLHPAGSGVESPIIECEMLDGLKPRRRRNIVENAPGLS